MDAKEAVRAAKLYLLDIYSDETIADLGLEEIEVDDAAGLWRITLGFSRSWDVAQDPLSVIVGTPRQKRAYKIVSMRNDGTVVSMRQREGLPA